MGSHIFNGATAPGASTPTSEEAPGVCGTEGPKDRTSKCLNLKQACRACKRPADLALLLALALHAAAAVLGWMGGAA